MCIYRNTAYKVWETDTPHCKGPDSYQGTVHTAPPAQSANRTFGKIKQYKQTKKPKNQQQERRTKNKTPDADENKIIHQVSLVQTAKGGRGTLPGSTGCHYSHYLAWNYWHKKEQLCDVKTCFEKQ